MTKKDVNSEDNRFLIGGLVLLIIVMFVCLGFVWAWSRVSVENSKLKQEMAYISEAPILCIDEGGACVYVLFNREIWELDVFDEMVDISTIQVGDIAIFIYDYNHTDADLINVRKR